MRKGDLSIVGGTIVAALSVLAGCGGSSSPTAATPVTTPPAPVSTVLAQGSGPIGTNILIGLAPFTTTATGTLDVTVDWTFATNNVEIYLAQGQCTVDQVNSRTCVFAGFSESPTAKPERLHLTALAAGTYSLMIGNRGPTPESVAYQIVFTQ